jgi:PST family polysaccharide transporter
VAKDDPSASLKPHSKLIISGGQSESSWIRFLPTILRSRFANRQNLQAALSNSSWLFWDKIVRMGTGLIVGLWLARYLGPSRFGELSFAVAFTGIFGAIATLGLDDIVVRELAKCPSNSDEILGSALVLRFGAALVSFGAVAVWISIMRRHDTQMIWFVMIVAAQYMFQCLNVVDLYFQSRVESKYTVYATNGAFVLVSAAKIVLLVLKAPLIAFAWPILIEYVIASIFLLWAYQFRGRTIALWRAKRAIMRDLLRDSWPLILSGLSVMISVRIDQVLIGQMLNDKEVGIYSAAARISEVWYFIPFAISRSMLPLLVESKKQGEAVYYSRLQKYSNVLALVSICFVLVIALLAGPITRMLYGTEYVGSARVLRVLIVGGALVPISAIWSYWMLLENRTKMMFYVNIFGSFLNVILNIIFIPRFGIIGSAYATLISYNAWMFVISPFVRSQRDVLKIMLRSVSLLWLFWSPQE